MLIRLSAVLALSILILSHETEAQVIDLRKDLSYYLPDEQTVYDEAIPTPESFFGFQVGEWHLRHAQLLDYMKTVAEKSDRIAIEEYGRSYEQRPLVLLTISSASNMAGIDEIREQHLQLTDPERSAILKTEEMPLVVWLGYSIHGNEASGSNAAALVAYYLAAAQSAQLDSILENTIILLDPFINPDGLDRFATWVNMHKGRVNVADPRHREHTEPWPSGRTNHYWFDLNRDWLLVQHPETKGRLAKFHEWKPNILTDHHEQGTNSTFFFQPGVPSRNHPLIPQQVVELTSEIGRFHAKALDKIGSLYFSRERYDDFYYGKGSTYPDVNGTIGILFEQASARGHVQQRSDGNLLTFPFAIRNHVTVSLSTLEAGLALRPKLLEHQRTFFTSALTEAGQSNIQAYLFGSAFDPARSHHLLEILTAHQIQVYRLAEQVTIANERFEPSHAFVIPTEQPQHRLITAMFEKRTEFRDSLFYDISAWTLPLAFGLPYAEYQGPAETLLGEPVAKTVLSQYEIPRSVAIRAYFFEWQHYYAPRALYRLLENDIPVKVATRKFQIRNGNETKDFDYGTIMIPVFEGTRITEIHSILATITSEDGVPVFAVDFGLSELGVDLGSGSFAPVRKPEVLFAVDRRTSAGQVGEAWHLLDQRYEIPVSIVETRLLETLNLDAYNAIVFFSGNYASINETSIDLLKAWHKRGGVLIGIQRGAKWLVDKELALAEFKSAERDTGAAGKSYANIDAERGAQVIGGAIFKAQLDITHPLGWGYDRGEIDLFRRGSLFMEHSSNPYATPVVYTDNPLQSGYISTANLELLKNSASIVVSGQGAGRSVLIMDNLNFRAFWYGTNKLFINAIIWSSLIKPVARNE